jgi:hypothetical protein
MSNKVEPISHETAIEEMKTFSRTGPFVGIFWIDDNDEFQLEL